MLRTRAFGIENELAVQAVDPERLLPQARDDVLVHEALRARLRPLFRKEWLPNGSRIYMDICRFLEVATAECTRLEDLVAIDEANIRWLAQRGRDTDVPDSIGTIRVYKINQDTMNVETRGTHESYQVFKDLLGNQLTPIDRIDSSGSPFIQLLAGALIPFLVTRQIYAGAGGINQTPDGEPEYVLSQRAMRMEQAISPSTTNARGIVNTRDEPLAGGEFLRLHLICGDANMSELATYLKVGATVWALSCIEYGMWPPLRLQHPVRAMHETARDLTGKRARLEFTSGRHYTPLEVQKIYLEHMRALESRHGRNQYSPALDRLEHTLALMDDADAVDLIAQCDHAFKFQLLRRFVTSRGHTLLSKQAAAVHAGYHWMDPEGLFCKYADAIGHTRVVQDDDVAQFYGPTGTPPLTRAFTRMTLVQEAYRQRRIPSVRWESVSILPRPNPAQDPNLPIIPIRTFYLPDPREM